MNTLDEEIIEACELTEVEQETMESKEVSELIVECIDRIKSVITEKTRETTLTTRESEGVLSHDKTVCTNSDMEKSGAPAVEHGRSRSLTTVDSC